MSRLDDYAALFQPSALTLARHLAGLRKAEVASAIGVSAAAISQYESGTHHPSAPIVAKLALSLGVPAAFLNHDVADDLSRSGRAFFRSLRSTRQIERDRAEAHIIAIRILVSYLERHVIFPEFDVPLMPLASDASRDDIEDAANQLRQSWELGRGPIASMTHLLESHGIIINQYLAGRREIDAFTRSFSSRAIITLVLDKDDQARQRFDSAHELGHLVMHDESESGNNLIEHQAQTFASAFLLPREAIIEELPRRADFRRLLQLKSRWGVSIAALLYRSRELGALSHDAHRRAMIKLSTFGWRTKEPGAVHFDEVPTLLRKAFTLVGQGKVTASTLAANAGLPEEIVTAALREPTGRPRVEP
jgi:Zn-dependent peptidase ImmA (M78 family)/DNA-binding XRE family transcriptional regulator